MFKIYLNPTRISTAMWLPWAKSVVCILIERERLVGRVIMRLAFYSGILLLTGCTSFVNFVEEQERLELVEFKEEIKMFKVMELCFEHDRQMKNYDIALNEAKVVAISEELKTRGEDPLSCRRAKVPTDK